MTNDIETLKNEIKALKKELCHKDTIIKALNILITADKEPLNTFETSSVFCYSRAVSFSFPYDDCTILYMNGSDLSLITPVYSCFIFGIDRSIEWFYNFQQLLLQKVAYIDMDKLIGDTTFQYDSFVLRREDNDEIAF